MKSVKGRISVAQEEKLELHKAAALWTEFSTKSQINAFKVLTAAPLGVAWNATNEMSLKSKLSWNSREQSKSKHFFHFNTKNRTPWKTAGGSKKPTFQYKELCQIESTSDALSWHGGLSSWSQPGDCLSIIWCDILYWSKKVPGVTAPHRGGKYTPPTKKINSRHSRLI